MRISDRASLVLTSLAGGDKHAYALVKDVESFAGVSLGPGTLYGALTRLERDGLIARLANLGLQRMALRSQ
jgi:DNA-binding PadR family transcriptional regulator